MSHHSTSEMSQWAATLQSKLLTINKLRGRRWRKQSSAKPQLNRVNRWIIWPHLPWYWPLGYWLAINNEAATMLTVAEHKKTKKQNKNKKQKKKKNRAKGNGARGILNLTLSQRVGDTEPKRDRERKTNRYKRKTEIIRVGLWAIYSRLKTKDRFAHVATLPNFLASISIT